MYVCIYVCVCLFIFVFYGIGTIYVYIYIYMIIYALNKIKTVLSLSFEFSCHHTLSNTWKT